MSEAYLNEFKKWNEDITETVPRKARLKLGVLLLLPFLLIFIGFLIYVTVYFASSALIEEKLPVNEVSTIFVILTGLGFAYVGYLEGNAVRNWKKITGTIERRSIGYKGSVNLNISYEYEGRVFNKRILNSRGLLKSEQGDPILLLVNPKKPYSFVSYADSSWLVSK